MTSKINDIEKARLKKIVAYMRTVDMAVVISEEAGEAEKFAAQGLDIKQHRDRMNRVDEHSHDIEYNFKDPEHPLQLVFVCAMWLTGFDAPTLSTLYLDKPMKDHTLMQTIARANRMTPFKINNATKKNGEIIKAKAPITPKLAIELEPLTGASASFWNKQERNYREFIVKQEKLSFQRYLFSISLNGIE